MIFRRIAFTNFAVFRGRQELTLPARSPERPVILIGGLNGSGKTSVIEGIVLGLYGLEGWRWWFRSGTGRRPDYHARITAALNHRARHDGEVEIAAEFELAIDDHEDTFFVRRRWWVDADGVEEDLEVRRAGIPIAPDCTPDERLSALQAHINELLPPEVSPFFFFDGERVRDYARHASPDRLRDGIDRLLKLDTLNNLLKHLGQLTARQDATETETLLREEDALTTAFKAKSAELDELHAEIERLSLERQQKDHQRQHLKQSAQAQFGGIEAELGALTEQMALHNQQAKDLGHELGAALGGPLPLALCLPLVQRLETAARRVVARRRTAERAADALIHIDRIITLAEHAGHTAPDDPLRQQLEAYRQRACVQPPLEEESALVEDMTDREVTELSRRVDEATHLADRDIRSLARTWDELTRKRQSVHDQMAQIRKGAQQTDYVSRIDTLAQEAGEAEGRIQIIESQLSKGEAESERLIQHLQDTRARILRSRAHNARGELLQRTTAVIETLRQRFRQDRLQRFAEQLQFTSAQLARKQDLFSRIELDLKTSALRLVDTTGREIEMSKLSSGEAQIVALALLWALSRSASTNLPCVLDTPLGRLDSAHRSRMAETYFKQAGAQVIILSTDEEIIGPYFDTLSGHIAASFRLLHDEKAESSRFTDDYFTSPTAS